MPGHWASNSQHIRPEHGCGRGLTIRSTGPYTACRQLARHFILGQLPSRCSGPVSSNVSHQRWKVCGAPTLPFQMQAFGIRCSLRVCNANSVLCHLHASSDTQKMHDAPFTGTSKFKNSTYFLHYILFLAKKFMKAHFVVQRAASRYGSQDAPASFFAPKTLVSKLPNYLNRKATEVAHISILALLANQSLNRTLCGGPRLAIISFLAKHGPPQSAG